MKTDQFKFSGLPRWPLPASASVLGATLMVSLLSADTTVPAQNVTSGQALVVTEAGNIATTGAVEIKSGGAALFAANGKIVLSPGFKAEAGSSFTALIDGMGGGIPGDTDGDGMTDAWELQHGFNPHNAADGAADPDADGIPNGVEHLLGTNPTAAAQSDTANMAQLKIVRPQ